MRARADLRCRFYSGDGGGGGGGSGSGEPMATVAATWRALDEAITCVAPPLGSAQALNTTVALSINAQTYTLTRVPFVYVPAPAPVTIEPISGPSLGGTLVTLTGSGFDASLGLECVFGSAVVDASLISPSEARCRSPSIGFAAPRLHGGHAFELGDLEVRGGARRMRTAVRLSARNASDVGAIEAPLPIGTPPLLDFEASWLLLLPSAAAAGARPDEATYRDAARLGFRYGPLHGAAFGGEGAAEGLSVSLSDGGPPLVVEVRLGGVTLLSRVLGAALPRAAWVRLAVNVTDAHLKVTSAGTSSPSRPRHLPNLPLHMHLSTLFPNSTSTGISFLYPQVSPHSSSPKSSPPPPNSCPFR